MSEEQNGKTKTCALHELTVENIQTVMDVKVASIKAIMLQEFSTVMREFKEELVSSIRGELKNTCDMVADHENRIRNIEKKIWKWAGIFIVAAGVVHVLTGALITAIVTTTIKMLHVLPTVP